MTNTTQTNSNYYRITAYHPTHDFTVIIDSNGMFEKLWKFSSFLVHKGFKIVDTLAEPNSLEYKTSPYSLDKIFLKYIQKGHLT